MTLRTFSLIILIMCCTVFSQEKNRDFVLPFTLDQGLVSQGSQIPQLYLASARFEPQYSFLNNLLRIGVTGGAFYTNRVVDFSGGPQVSIRLFSLTYGPFGSIFDIYLRGEALWGTRDRKLWGGGLTLDAYIADLFVRFYHEYQHKEFWFSAGLGVNIDIFFKKKYKQ